MQGLVAAALLTRRAVRRRVAADALLAAILLVCSADLTEHLIGWAGAYDRWPDLLFFPFESAFALGPLVWLHTRSLVDGGFRLRPRLLLHALPFLVEKAYYLWLWAHPLAWKGAWETSVHLPLVQPAERLLATVVTGAYLLAAWRTYGRYRRWVDDTQSDAGLRLDWLRRLLLVAAAAFGASRLMLLVGLAVPLGYAGWFVYYAVLAVLSYYLAVTGLTCVPSPPPADAPAAGATGGETRDERQAQPSDPPAPASALAPADLARWTARLEAVMQDDEPWRDPQLTLADLARRLATSASVLSAVVNRGTGLHFNDFVNGYRIRDVQRRIADGEVDRRGLLPVAFAAGFNAKSTFNRAFRKATGVSPSEFRTRQLGTTDAAGEPTATHDPNPLESGAVDESGRRDGRQTRA